MIEHILIALIALPIGLGLLVAAGFGLLLIGTALYYLIVYGRLP